ncbi:carbohydrate-binding module family 20 domain-containing protein [Pseudomonas sp. B11(2017)]|uniref:carbohydrate-binding module family 20 domain-containing protein n=1 Tax=Pseudomonas sp. B11(2017) TaxID=1981748 RepID=UPI000A1F36E2|nr:carbohydrate-binding module family 20 domain-containing protein [Pseudomonas sp. B11(2017)]
MDLNRCLLPLCVFALAAAPRLASSQDIQLTYKLPVVFKCVNSPTEPGYSVYVVGNLPDLGNWKPADAKPLTLIPNSMKNGNPKINDWTGTHYIDGSKPGDELEWKCIVRSEKDKDDKNVVWQPGANNKVQLTFGDSVSVGDFAQSR